MCGKQRWTTYEIQSGDLEGWGLEPGCFVEHEGDQENSFRLPFVRTDAAIYYRRNNWRAALNFKIFDVDYIRSSAGFRASVYPGEPFTVRRQVSVEF